MPNKLQLCKRLNWNYFCHILLLFWFESHPIQIWFWQLQFLFFRLLQGNKLRIWHFSLRYLLEFEMSHQDGNEFREMSFGHLSVLTIVVWWFQSLFRPKLTLDWPIRAEHERLTDSKLTSTVEEGPYETSLYLTVSLSLELRFCLADSTKIK